MRLRLKQILYVACGITFSGAAVFGVGNHLDKSEQEGKTAFVEYLSDIMMSQADGTISNAISGLDLAQRLGAVSCTTANLKKLQAIALARPSISEIGVVNGSGFLVCSSSGLNYRFVGKSKSIYHKPTKLHFAATVEPDPANTTLVLNRSLPGAYGLQVIVTRQALFNNPLHSNLQNSGHVRVALANSIPLVQGGNLPEHSHSFLSPGIQAQLRTSTAYPITTSVEVASKALPGGTFSTLRIFIYLGGFVFCILTGILAYDLSQRERPLSGAVRTGLARKEFIPFYQPIIDGRTGGIAGCEVLLRWRKQSGEIIMPHMFIPEIENNGQIDEVTRALMKIVQEEMAGFQLENPGFFYSINLTANHLANNEIIDDVQKIFPVGNSAITPDNLIFEVTERQPLKDMDTARLIIEGLQSIGSKVALDDAGTGHGGMSYIQHLGIDKIKIDKMFVEAIGKGGPTAPIVDALLTMSRELKIRVIAEGVETAEQFDYLYAHGVDFLQGFLFAKPMPRNAFVHYYNMYHRELVEMKSPPAPINTDIAPSTKVAPAALAPAALIEAAE